MFTYKKLAEKVADNLIEARLKKGVNYYYVDDEEYAKEISKLKNVTVTKDEGKLWKVTSKDWDGKY